MFGSLHGYVIRYGIIYYLRIIFRIVLSFLSITYSNSLNMGYWSRGAFDLIA